MNYPKCGVFAAVLMCMGTSGCMDAEKLTVSPAGAESNATAAGQISSNRTASPTSPGELVPPALTSPEVPDVVASAVVLSPEVVAPDTTTPGTIPVAGPETNGEPESIAESAPPPAWWQPKASEQLTWQWQLQGEIDTSLPVQVYNVDIDVPQEKLDELSDRGVKLICYFSAGTVESFRSDAGQFSPEIIGEQYEDLVDERWVDYANIDALAPIMRARLAKCKSKGFDAVEIDNVDAHNYETRNAEGEVINIGTSFKMTLDESIAYVRWLTREAHSRGLGIGLKNAEEMVADVVDEVDWMLVEDCYFDSWCMAATAFIDADKPVFMAEYDELVPDFTPACELAKSLGYSAIWRDSSLSTELYLACE